MSLLVYAKLNFACVEKIGFNKLGISEMKVDSNRECF